MMKIYSVKVNNVDEDQLNKIIELKNQSWNYPVFEHRRWIKANLASNDEHVLIENDKELIAYANIVNVHITIDGKEEDAIGLGNVCVALKEKGKGFGKLLISYINVLIKEKMKAGILFCKDSLVPFYSSSGWKKVSEQVTVKVKDKIFQYNTLLYNCNNIPLEELISNTDF